MARNTEAIRVVAEKMAHIPFWGSSRHIIGHVFGEDMWAEAWPRVNALEMVFEDDTTESLDSKAIKNSSAKMHRDESIGETKLNVSDDAYVRTPLPNVIRGHKTIHILDAGGPGMQIINISLPKNEDKIALAWPPKAVKF